MRNVVDLLTGFYPVLIDHHLYIVTLSTVADENPQFAAGRSLVTVELQGIIEAQQSSFYGEWPRALADIHAILKGFFLVVGSAQSRPGSHLHGHGADRTAQNIIRVRIIGIVAAVQPVQPVGVGASIVHHTGEPQPQVTF